jgi:DNA-binding PadR family transcriptional regulator
MRFGYEGRHELGYEGHHERRFGARKHGRFGHGHRRHFGRSWMDDREGGRRRLFDSGELRLVLLKLISDQPRHGYDLIRAIEELTGGAYAPSPGVVYPALSVLQDLGHIEGAEAESSRKAFSITQSGTGDLAANAAQVKALLARLAALAATREQTDSAPIRRAMENLRSVLRNRLGSESVGKDTLHEVAAILDEAARRIERL